LVWLFGHWILITVISNQSTSNTNVVPGPLGYKSGYALSPPYGFQPRNSTSTKTIRAVFHKTLHFNRWKDLHTVRLRMKDAEIRQIGYTAAYLCAASASPILGGKSPIRVKLSGMKRGGKPFLPPAKTSFSRRIEVSVLRMRP
jgi:hypothetical protein